MLLNRSRLALACVLAANLGLTGTAFAQTSSVEKAAGRPAIASSTEKAGLEPAKGNDASGTSRWGSSWTDNQWWQVDLGSTRTVSEVSVHWEYAVASRYRIER